MTLRIVINALSNLFLKKVLYALLFILIIAACSKEPTAKKVDFEILSFNTFLLDTPDITIGPSCESDCVARAENVCEVLSSRFDNLPDVLLFQEVFEQDACESLQTCLTSLGYTDFSPCLESDPTWENGCLIKSTKTSGLFVASKTQILDYSFDSFVDCNGCLLWGSDCQANKGFQYFRIVLSNTCEVEIVNTHLDAGSGPEDVATRKNQSTQILSHIDQKSAGSSAIIIAGDLNTEEISELDNFASVLSVRSLNTTDPTSDSGKVLDHILITSSIADNDSEIILAKTCEQDCEGWFDSDHIAISVKLSIKCDN